MARVITAFLLTMGVSSCFPFGIIPGLIEQVGP